MKNVKNSSSNTHRMASIFWRARVGNDLVRCPRNWCEGLGAAYDSEKLSKKFETNNLVLASTSRSRSCTFRARNIVSLRWKARSPIFRTRDFWPWNKTSWIMTIVLDYFLLWRVPVDCPTAVLPSLLVRTVPRNSSLKKSGKKTSYPVRILVSIDWICRPTRATNN